MELYRLADLHSKQLGNHCKNNEKIPRNLLLKKLEKSWKSHGIMSVRKSGNPVKRIVFVGQG